MSKEFLSKSLIKAEVRRVHDMQVWADCLVSPLCVVRPYLRVRDKSYMGWEKVKSQAIFAYRTGSLKFCTSWRIYNIKRGNGIKCVMNMCPENDTFEHAKVCSFYDTKWNENWTTEEEIAEYIVALNRERFRRQKMPIL